MYLLLKDEVSMELRFEDKEMKKSLMVLREGEEIDEKPGLEDDMDSVNSMETCDEDYCGYPTDPPENIFTAGKCWKEKTTWVILLPIKIIFFLTIPDLRRPKCQKLVSLTFIASIIWIGIAYSVFSFFSLLHAFYFISNTFTCCANFSISNARLKFANFQNLS